MAIDALIYRVTPRNTRQQDLYLLAKGAYDCGQYAKPVNARHLVALHNGVKLEHMRWADVAQVVIHDLVPLLSLDLTGNTLERFLIELLPGPMPMLGSNYQQEGGVAAVLVERLMSHVTCMKVVDDNREWRLPFPNPVADTTVRDALAAQVAEDAAAA